MLLSFFSWFFVERILELVRKLSIPHVARRPRGRNIVQKYSFEKFSGNIYLNNRWTVPALLHFHQHLLEGIDVARCKEIFQVLPAQYFTELRLQGVPFGNFPIKVGTDDLCLLPCCFFCFVEF